MARLTKAQRAEREAKLARFEAECAERARVLHTNRFTVEDALRGDGEAADVIQVALEGVGLSGAYTERDAARGRIELCRIRALELRLSARLVTPDERIAPGKIQAIEDAAPPEERDAARLARVSRWFDRFARQDLDKREVVAAVLRGEPSDPFLVDYDPEKSAWQRALS